MEKTGAPLKILVVDDEVKMCSTVKKFLEHYHYSVEVAYDGKETLAKLETFRPQCVLLDVRMPALDGIAALKAIKRDRPETAVIMITGVTSAQVTEECLQAGAADYIIKPVKFDELIAKIRQTMNLDGGAAPVPPEKK